jgi:outer membrane protein assembly factor BamA
VLRKILPDFFGGLELDYQKLYNVEIDKMSSSLPVPNGGTGTTNFGVGAGLVYDNRHNALNVRKGTFAELAFLNYSPGLGSDYKFHSITVDGRIYRTVKKNQVFAAQVYGQFISGNPPFNQLALMGGEGMMRGYYTGRYRDRKYLAAQAEYRFLPLSFSKRIGATVFLASGVVSPSMHAFSLKNVLPSGGVGLRYLAFPKKDIFLRFDVGFTREGPSFYIYSGEAF